MWALAVIFCQPALYDFPRFIQGSEPTKIQYLCPVGPVKTFDKGILRWLTGFDKLPHHAVFFSPLRQSQ